MKDALAKTDNLDPLETILWKARWHDYDTLLSANTFLMLYAHTEEWLHLLSKKHYPQISIQSGGSITRYKSVLRNGFRMDLAGDVWCLLTDCEKIRNCLLHANGRVDLMKEKDKPAIKNAAKRRGLNINLERLEIPPKFLASIAKEVEAFIDGLG